MKVDAWLAGQSNFRVLYLDHPAVLADPPEASPQEQSFLAGLRANPDIRVIVNQNDFLLEDEDMAWLRTTFPPQQLTVFNKGGHLGNLANPTLQKAVLAALTPMRPPERKSK